MEKIRLTLKVRSISLLMIFWCLLITNSNASERWKKFDSNETAEAYIDIDGVGTTEKITTYRIGSLRQKPKQFWFIV